MKRHVVDENSGFKISGKCNSGYQKKQRVSKL